MNAAERASVALTPFVKAWGLPLNPENLDLMAAAMIIAVDGYDSDSDPQDIYDKIQGWIDEDHAQFEAMVEKMKQRGSDTAT